jgi:ParB/RepB/Spo0J family partition protein
VSPERLPLEDLQPNPLNPRYTGEDPEVVELAESFKSVGQLPAARIVSRGQFTQIYPDEPIGAQPWVVFIGNRRLAAAPLAEVTHLDVRHDGGLTTADELKDRILVENLHRKDLPPLKEAEALRRRLTRPGVTTRSVGAAIGKSHTYVEQRVTLLGMLPELQDLFRAGQVSIQVGRKLGGWPEAEQRAFLAAGPPYELPVPAPASAGAAVSEAGTATGTVPAGNSATSGGGAAEAAAGNGVARTGGDAAIVARHGTPRCALGHLTDGATAASVRDHLEAARNLLP